MHTRYLTYWILACALFLSACAALSPSMPWTTLLENGKGMDNFVTQGDANWRVDNGLVLADQGKGGFLVTKKSYKDFEIRAEFWAASDTNSGIFIRATNPQKIGADTSYEVNIWDIRPDPKYGSGAIVDFAAVTTPLQNTVGGKWNVLEIRAVGNEITVILNGIQTVKLNNSKFAAGPFALQYGAGVKGALGGPIKWRKVQVREVS